MTYSQQHLDDAIQIIRQLDTGMIEKAVEQLRQIRDRGGRLFILGVGGSAANASHAVNDFRKICGFEAYAPTDNVSELTARTNDEGWAKDVGATVIGVVGRDGGYTAKVADVCVIVPTVNPTTVTPHSEAFQAVIWHLLVSHPQLKIQQTKWESTK